MLVAMLLLIKVVLLAPSKVLVTTIAQNGSYVLSGAQSMALTGDIVVDDGAVLSLEGDAADLAALGTIRSRSC